MKVMQLVFLLALIFQYLAMNDNLTIYGCKQLIERDRSFTASATAINGETQEVKGVAQAIFGKTVFASSQIYFVLLRISKSFSLRFYCKHLYDIICMCVMVEHFYDYNVLPIQEIDSFSLTMRF